MSHLPRTATGLPIPYFVRWINGRPDFRIADKDKLPKVINKRLCWVCGQPLGRYFCFVVGPMCVVNRVSAEPPSHHDCAEYSLRTCPFLTRPAAVRRDAGKPDGIEVAGIMLEHNPGTGALYSTRSYKLEQLSNGILFAMGKPERVSWWREGRTATRAEVDAAMEKGLPVLRGYAEEEGAESLANLARQVNAARALLPA